MDDPYSETPLAPGLIWPLAEQVGTGFVVRVGEGLFWLDEEARRLVGNAPGDPTPTAATAWGERWLEAVAAAAEPVGGWQNVDWPEAPSGLQVRARPGAGPGLADVQLWEVRGAGFVPVERLLEVIAGVTSGAVGEAFCRRLALQIGPVLGCQRLVMARLLDPVELRCRSVVVWSHGRLLPGREFIVLADSGSAQVLREGRFETWGDLPTRFPEWTTRLSDHDPASVVSVALTAADGSRQGFISAFFARGVAHKPEVALGLRVLATRVAAELEREEAQQALSRSERRLRDLLERLPGGVLLLDAGAVRFVNPVAARLFGFADAAALRAADRAGCVESWRAGVWAVCREAGAQPVAVRLRRADGAEFDAEISVATVRLGEVETLQVLLRDVTVERQMAQAIEAVTRATAGVLGRAFLEQLTQELGLLLGAVRVVIARYLDGGTQWAESVAVWERGRWVAAPKFALLPGTFSAAIRDEGELEEWTRLAERFPASAEVFAARGIQAVLARSLVNGAGRAIGHISVAFGPGAERKAHRAGVLKLFAARATLELERSEADAALRESERRTRLALERLSAGVVIVAEGRRLRFVNPEAARLLGLGDAAAVMARGEVTLPAATWAEFERVEASATAGAGAAGDVVVLERCDGSKFDAEISRQAWVDEGPPAWQIMFRDVTVHRRYVRAIEAVSRATGGLVGLEFLQQFVRELGLILQARRVVIVEFLDAECTRARHVAAWNEEGMVPLTEFTVTARGATAAVLREGRVEQWGGLAERFPDTSDWYARRGVGSLLGSSVYGAGGQVLGHVSASFSPATPRLEHAGPIVDLFAVRVGAEMERMRHEELNRRMAVQLEAAQRMEALGRLAGGVAHDFNNMLASIMGNLELAALDVPAEGELAGLIQEAMGGAKRARDVVAQLLTFSQRRAPRLVPTALAGIVAEACRLMQAALPANVRLEFSATPQLPAVRCDPTQIHQVVVNLCTNAVHALPESGGRIRVSLRLATRSKLTGDGTEPRVCLEVEDDGEGMSAEVKERLFEPFFTTKVAGRGSGLGLATVHGIVGSLRGAIEVESELGCGTVFRVLLPVSPDAPPPETVAPAAPAVRQRHRIAIVDDKPAVLRVMGRLVEQLGFVSVCFSDPLLALQAVLDDASIGGVVTDYAMPGLDGVGLIGRIKRERPKLPCWLISGNANTEVRQAAVKAGAAGVLDKPVELVTLSHALAAGFTVG